MTGSSDVALTALAAYLKAEIPELSVSEKWPDPKKKLTMPALTLVAPGERGYNHVQPTIFKQIAVESNPELIDVVYTVGEFGYKIQLDLWCEYAEQRSVLIDKVHKALNKQFINGDAPCGLSLTLSAYYDLIARFDQVGYTYLDSEESSQRSEWRVKIDVNVNHSRLELKRESKMLDIQIHHQISDTIDVEDTDDESIQETEII